MTCCQPRAFRAGFSRLRLHAALARFRTLREMKALLRTYLAISLALMLALTGQSMAVARGSSDPSGQMVLCTGTGPVAIYVDESGTPTGPPVFCPDCALNLLSSFSLPDAPALPAIAKPVVLPILVAQRQGVPVRTLAIARAPPRLI